MTDVVRQGSVTGSGCLTTRRSVCRLADDLVNYILKLAVKESCVLLSSAQTCCDDQAAFDALLCSVPVSTLEFYSFATPPKRLDHLALLCM